jgi:hypothetical protein
LDAARLVEDRSGGLFHAGANGVRWGKVTGRRKPSGWREKTNFAEIMKNSDIKDALFLQAVEAVDAGDVQSLRGLVEGHPRLIRDRLEGTEKGYFERPYLLWFVADNPIRHLKLPDTIVEVTRLLIDFVKRFAPETAEFQIGYTLGLVATGRIPRECGVQIEMIDLLLDAGAKPNRVEGVIGHGNLEAAAHLIQRGAELTLPAAVGLGWQEDMQRLAATASADEIDLALLVAAFFGKADILRWLVGIGARVNHLPDKCYGFHSHATPLHQAVYSGSLEAVQVLVGAGADVNAMDKAYSGTPLGWAMYMQTEEGVGEEMRERYKIIEAYLKGQE